MTRKKILVLTQTLPAFSGQGTAMRLGNILEVLAPDHDITLICVSLNRTTPPEILGEHWKTLCARAIFFNVADAAEPLRQRQRLAHVRILSPQPKMHATWPMTDVLRELAEFQGAHYDHVLVSRIRLMPVWRALESELGVRADYKVLDLDDIESRSQAMQVKMLGIAHLGKVGYLMEWLESSKLAREESRAFKEMDKVVLCSSEDKIMLTRRFRAEKIAVIPNTIRVPGMLPEQAQSDKFQLLFVGTLDYTPNEHAVKWLVDAILPEIERRAGKGAVNLVVVGRGPTAWMQARADGGVFALHGNVPDVQPFYAACDVVLVPILAGGGTRIKILEAFGYGRVVLSTTLGAEGIDAENNQELMIANTAVEFANAVAILIRNREVGQKLIASARRKVIQRYSMAACKKAVDTVFA